MSEVKVLDWDDEIVDDGQQSDFVTLEDGNYDFEVIKFERTHYTPSASAKTPACNQATMSLKIETEEGVCIVRDNFPLASTMEWKMSAFFRCIGMKKHGEAFKMDWNGAVGHKGKAHIIKVEGTNGGIFFNNVDRYIEPKGKEEDVEWS